MRVGSVQYRYTVPCRDHLGAICGRSEYARCGVRDGAHAAANQPSASQSTLSVPRLEAFKRCRNQVTAVRDVVVRADIRHATLGGVSVGAMAGRGIADSDKFMVPWHELRRLLSKRLLLVLVYSRNNTFDLAPGI